MINEYLKEMEYQIRTKFNRYDHYLHKLPILKNKPLFQFKRLKNISIALSPIYNLFQSFTSTLASLTFFGAMFYFFNLFIFKSLSNSFNMVQVHGLKSGVFYTFLLTNIVISSLFSLWGDADDLRMFYNFFHLDPAKIYRMRIFLKGSIEGGMQALAYALGSILLGFPYYYGLMVAFLLYMWNFLTEGIHIYLYEKKFVDIQSQKWIGIFIFSYFAAIILSIFVPFSVEAFLFHPLQILILIGGFIGAVYTYKYKDIKKLVLEMPVNAGETKDGEPLSKQVALQISKLEDKDFESGARHIKTGLTGYELLNELFFQRHRRIILKPYLIKSAIVAFLSLAISIAILYFPDIKEGFLKEKEAIDALTNFLPFVCYFLFFQENLTKIIFVNCDQALLQYGFYRRPKDLLKMFRYRLKKMLLWSSLLLLTSEVGIFFILKSLGLLEKENMIIFLLPLTLWFFFSIHTLFMYYFFQPYTKDYETKSFAFHIANIFIYIICFQISKLELSRNTLVSAFLIGSLVYTGIALFLVYKKSPERFRLKD